VLLGVLGSLQGAREAFAIAASARAAGDAEYWNQLAVSTTPLCLGLAVAAILIVGRGYLMSQADAISGQIREFSARLINALIDRPDVRLGHR